MSTHMEMRGSRSSFATSQVGLLRDYTAYWLLGVCNDYGFVVMLCAAYDILGHFANNDHADNRFDTTKRCCQTMSTGTILLADILPLMLCKSAVHFVPLWVNMRMSVVVVLAACSFVLVAFAQARWMVFLGVICTSASCGIGEATLLAYSFSFNKNVITSWYSGTGAAGLLAAVSYAMLIYYGYSHQITMLIFLIVPAFQAISFWYILRKPRRVSIFRLEYIPQEVMNYKEKCVYILKDLTLKYIAPLSLVYFSEYLINQGLYELIYFHHIFIDHAEQYRWYHVLYHVGVVVSRSSVRVVELERIWLMAILQCVNAALFTLEAIYFFTPTIWIVFFMIFYEGLLGGAAYINACYMMSQKVPPQRRKFALNVVTRADSYGILLAGCLAIPLHSAICSAN